MNPSIAPSLQLFLAGTVHAGFPSPADDYLEPVLDLNEMLVPHPASSFLVRVKGHSMRDMNINEGDLLVVDRSVKPESGRIAVCYLDGEFTVKLLKVGKEGITLLPANPDFPAIPVPAESTFTVFGVVTWAIHQYGHVRPR